MELLLLKKAGGEQLLIGHDALINRQQTIRDLLFVHEEGSDLTQIECIQIGNRDFVGALSAHVLCWATRADIHLLPTVTFGQSAKELHRRATGFKYRLFTACEDVIGLLPDFFRDDRIAGQIHPVLRVFQAPCLLVVFGAGIVGDPCSLTGWIFDQTLDRGSRPVAPRAGAVPSFIQKAGNRSDPPLFQKELVHVLAHWGFNWISNQLVFFPAQAIGRSASKFLSKLCTYWDRGGNPRGDLFSFPLGEGRNQSEVQTSSRGGGVDTFSKGDEVGTAFLKDIREGQQLTGVAGETGELGEDQRFDMPPADIGNHPLGFGMIDDGLA